MLGAMSRTVRWVPWLVWAIAVASGCAEESRVASAAKTPSAPEPVAAAEGGGAQAQPEAAPPADGDSRFGQDVPAQPPPRPVREIDRSGGDEGKRGEATGTATAALGHARPVDTTMGGGDTGPSAASEAPHDAAMLVYTAHLTMAVYQVAPAIDAIEVIGRSFGGYLSSRTDTQIVIRVPRARFDEALHKIEATGDVLHREVTAEDVTDQYVDMDARLRNARAVRDRLEALLQKAAVKEAIEIQRELERVTAEIETLEGKLKLLKDRVAYSVIGVTFEARGEAAVREKPLRLPFPWLGQLGLPHLLDLGGQ